MENYRLTKKADDDLSQTYEYGILNFGLEQAQSYLLGLYDRLQSIVENPLSGHAVDFLAPELRRTKYKAHIIFYISDNSGVLIVRILRSEMDFYKYL